MDGVVGTPARRHCVVAWKVRADSVIVSKSLVGGNTRNHLPSFVGTPPAAKVFEFMQSYVIMVLICPTNQAGGN
jgi:hypothetical protein